VNDDRQGSKNAQPYRSLLTVAADQHLADTRNNIGTATNL